HHNGLENTEYDNYMRLYVDSRENYYVTRNQQNMFSIDYYANYGAIGFKIIKYDAAGNKKWEVQPSLTNSQIGSYSSGPDAYVNSTINTITSDADGNVYFGGNFSGSHLIIGNKDCHFNSLTSYNGFPGAYLAKVDSNGVCQWIMGFLNNPNNPQGNLTSITINYQNSQAIYIGTQYTTKIIDGYGSTIGQGSLPTSYELVRVNAAGQVLSRANIFTDGNWYSYACFDPFCSEGADHLYLDEKLLRYKDKLIHVSITNNSYIYLAGNQQTVYNDSSNLYAYVIVTDTVGNLINMFKPIRFYNYGAGITNSDKLINYIP